MKSRESNWIAPPAQLLDHNGISIDDAARGQVTRMPNVPYIAPRKDLPSTLPSIQETPPPAQP